jgi:hypothetical protein
MSISWDSKIDTFVNTKNTDNSNKMPYFKKREGENRIRILTTPFPYISHQVKKNLEDPKDYGSKITCAKVNGVGNCPACQLHEMDERQARVSKRFMCAIFNRATSKVELFDMSGSDVQKIQAAFPKGKTPLSADLIITYNSKHSNPSMKTIYTREDPEPLSAEEQVLRDNIDLDYLKKLTMPLKTEWAQARIDKILGVLDDAPKFESKQANASFKKPPMKPVQKVQIEDTDGDDDFPSV